MLSHPLPPAKLARVHSFTLAEMLVAIAVLSLLVLVLAGILNATGQAWLSAESGNDSFREARAALFVMRHDLQNAHISLYTPMVINDNSLPVDGVTPTPGTNIFFFATMPQSAQQTSDDTQNTGDLCQIGYYVAFTEDANGASSSKLYRYFRPSAYAYTNINNYVASTSGGSPPSPEQSMQTLFAGLGPLSASATGTGTQGTGDLGNGKDKDEVVAHNVSNLNISWRYSASADPTPIYTEGTITTTAVEISFALDALNSRFAVQYPNQSSWVGLSTNAAAYRLAVHSFSDQASIPASP